MENQSTQQPMVAVAVAGGGGGVGRTSIAVELAIAFGRIHESVWLLDASLGFGQVDLALGMLPTNVIEDVCSGNASLDKVMVQHPTGIKVLPSSRTPSEQPTVYTVAAIVESLRELEQPPEVLVIDCPAWSNEVTALMESCADFVLLVVRDDPVSIQDNIIQAKRLQVQYGIRKFGVLINQYTRNDNGASFFNLFRSTAERFVDAVFLHYGTITDDPAFAKARRSQKSLAERYPLNPNAQTFNKVARQILMSPFTSTDGRLSFSKVSGH